MTVKRPPIALNPSIPLVIQRAIRSVSDYAFGANDKADAATAGLATKVSKDEQGLLEVSQFASKQLSAGGSYPINLTGLNGRSQESQLAYVPQVPTLPSRPNSLTSNGQLVWYNNELYRFNQAGGSVTSPVQPGQWQAISGLFLTGIRAHRQDHTNFPQFDPTTLAIGAAFYETDTQLVYVVLPDTLQAGTPNNWFYAIGVWQMYWPWRNAPFTVGGFGIHDWDYTDNNAQLLVNDFVPSALSGNGSLIYTVEFVSGSGVSAVYLASYQLGIFTNLAVSRPTTIPSTPSSGLVATDAGFTTFCGNVGHTWRWTGIAGWTWNSGEGAGDVVLAPVTPNPGTGYWALIPVGGGSITVSDPSGGPGTSFTYPAYTAFQTANPGWNMYARL